MDYHFPEDMRDATIIYQDETHCSVSFWLGWLEDSDMYLVSWRSQKYIQWEARLGGMVTWVPNMTLEFSEWKSGTPGEMVVVATVGGSPWILL